MKKDKKTTIIILLLIALIGMAMWRNHILYGKNPSNEKVTNETPEVDTPQTSSLEESEIKEVPDTDKPMNMQGMETDIEVPDIDISFYQPTGNEWMYGAEELPYILQIEWKDIVKEETEELVQFSGSAGGYMYINGNLYYFQGEIQEGGILNTLLIGEDTVNAEDTIEIWFLTEEELAVTIHCKTEKVTIENKCIFAKM